MDAGDRTRLATVLILATLSPVSLRAQTPTADVTGVVRDSTRRPLSDVEIRAVDHASGFTYRTFSSSSGRYWLRELPPGSYDITARRIGLRTRTTRDVALPVGRTVPIDFMLGPSPVEVGAITAKARAPVIETTQSEIAYVLDRQQIERLPDESRNFIELARLVPGATAGTAVTGGPPSFGTRGSLVGALNQQSMGVLVDGGDLTEPFFGELGGSVPLLAIQEFEVVESGYSAQLGRAASGIVNVVTRRGGNRLRMEAFGLYRDRVLNARGAFEAEKPDYNRSHWGLAAGGPIVADRTHFFAAFERRVQNDFATVNTGGAFPAYEGTFRTPLTDNLIFARLDHRASDAHQLTVRYAGEIGEQLSGVGGISAFEHGSKTGIDMHSGLLADRWAMGRDWINEARLHVIHTRRSLARNATSGPTLFYKSLEAGPVRRHGSLRDLRVELRDHLSHIVAGRTGTHRLGLGAQLSWQDDRMETFFFDNGLFLFPSDTAVQPNFAQVTYENGAIRLDARNLQLGFFLEDDWNPIPELTLNLGLRYDIETNGSDQGFVSPYAGDLPFIPTKPRPIDTNDLGPRIGIAWDPKGDGLTVVRGGFGIFYDALAAVPVMALERSTGVRTARIRNPGTTDVDALGIDPDTLPPTVWTEGGIRTPMTRQYSVGVEHALPGGVVVRVDGLLIQGRNLLLQRELNPVGTTGPRYPGFAQILQVLSDGRATAKMLLFEARKRFARGWFTVAYTLADRKDTNDTWGGPLVPQTDPDSLHLDREWGPTAWDERHRVVATGGVELPFGLDVVGKVVYASPRPFTAVADTDYNGDSQKNDRPPGEGRNARRGPDYFRTDLGITWNRLSRGSARFGVVVNVYNLFNTTNGVPSSVQNIVGNPDLPPVGQPSVAYPRRQVEVGLQATWGGRRP